MNSINTDKFEMINQKPINNSTILTIEFQWSNKQYLIIILKTMSNINTNEIRTKINPIFHHRF